MLDTGWSIGFKYIIIIISTLVGFVVMYEGFIKKIGSAGVLFGLKPKSYTHLSNSSFLTQLNNPTLILMDVCKL
jgi:hypothetical protein